MEFVILCAAIIGALVLFAPPVQPASPPEFILIQARPEPLPEGDLGCLPLLACVFLIVIVVSAL